MRRCLLVIGVAMLASSAFAQQKDAANCADHPLLTRLPNYWISSCKHTQFDAYKFNVGKTTKPVEGEFWEIRYQPPASMTTKPSTLQMTRNVENAIERAGGKSVFAGE